MQSTACRPSKASPVGCCDHQNSLPRLVGHAASINSFLSLRPLFGTTTAAAGPAHAIASQDPCVCARPRAPSAAPPPQTGAGDQGSAVNCTARRASCVSDGAQSLALRRRALLLPSSSPQLRRSRVRRFGSQRLHACVRCVYRTERREEGIDCLLVGEKVENGGRVAQTAEQRAGGGPPCGRRPPAPHSLHGGRWYVK